MEIILYGPEDASPGWRLKQGAVSMKRLARHSMDFQETAKHAAKCDPLLTAMTHVIELVLEEDIIIEWNGGPRPSDVKVERGRCKSHFGLGTVTFEQSWIWRAPENMDLLIGPQPLEVDKRITCMDAVVPGDLDYPWFPTLQMNGGPGRYWLPDGAVIASVRLVPRSRIGWSFGKKPERVADREALHGKQRKNKATLIRRRSVKRLDSVEEVAPDVLVGSGWLRRGLCRKAISEEYVYNKWRKDVGLFYPKWPDWDYEVWGALMDVQAMIEIHTGRTAVIDNPHFVHWKPVSGGMPMHRDITEEYPHRDWATLIYLNTVKEGGATHFGSGLRIEPVRGRMMSCPCGTMEHGVEAALEDRHTLICWWTLT